MAKISARGATKLMQARRDTVDEDGWTHRHRRALRSDGAILKAHDLLAASGRWNRGGYSVLTKLPASDSPALWRAHFREYYGNRGYTVEDC